MKHTSTKGFTLIEILIVVSIIGLLASVILVGLGGFRSRGRDTRRVADLKAIQNGLELYYSRNNQYPSNLSDLLSGGIGVNKLPKDPSSNSDYYYSYTASRQSYIVAAQLEADASDVMYNDSAEISTSGYTGSVPSCARAQKYYCVSF
ncbi:MAG TPA: prepilin-type N-terminal cleavage/methylation domain-containing protein [Candidatus Paceibacterota bacterium]